MAAEYDPHSYRIHEDPYPIYAALRKRCPVYHNERLDFWALLGFREVQEASRDWRALTTAHGTFLQSEVQAVQEFFPEEGKFLDMDPPRHTELRNLIRGVFSAREIQKQELKIRAIARKLIDKFTGGKVDLSLQFAAPFPVSVISELLGIPECDEHDVAQWSHDLHLRETDGSLPEVAMKAGHNIHNYLQAMVDERRRSPRLDIVSRLAHSAIGGKSLTDREVIGMSLLLYVAGNETTRMFLTSAFRLLAENPEERARLARDCAAIPAAIEEMLRFESPISQEARTATREIEISGCPIPTGKQVLLVYGSANRDERAFADADKLIFSRPPQRHLAFGEGIHYCIGAALARCEARVALEETLARIPNYKLDGPVEWYHSSILRGPVTLPVTL
ncbi:MAG TPA: cytochrome P450 [Bryobacteraceae bacterium]|nr:cytochrome P450 [Bryobacteraceae bacterium]